MGQHQQQVQRIDSVFSILQQTKTYAIQAALLMEIYSNQRGISISSSRQLLETPIHLQYHPALS